MKKILFFSLFIILIAQFTNAQETTTLNLALRNYVNENPNSTEPLQLLVLGNESTIEIAVKNLGGNFKYAVQNISAVTLPVNKIFQLAQTPGIKRMEGRHGIGNTLDDQTDIHANITAVKQGQAPLPQAYDGTGVVIGIIDTEIDIAHPDFIDAGGNTRIKYLWSQLDIAGGTTPMPYNYGQEWNAADIDAGCLYVPTTSAFGHGSVVTGAACGDPANTLYQGVAPKTDIIFVAADLGLDFLNNTVDAVNYIYEKAALLGKPCVINASVGTYNGSHDALDLPAITIENLIAADSARSMVAAAGNAGNRSLHLQYPAEIDSAYTWFKVNPSTQSVIYELWAYKSQFDFLQFALGADLISPYTYLGRTNYYNILSDFSFTSGYAQLNDTLKTWAGVVIAPLTIQAEIIDTTYHLLVTISTNNALNLYRLISKGIGQFDLWSHPNFTGTSDMIKTATLPPVATFPDVARYRTPNQDQTIVSSFQCSNKVITVANFNNRNSWIDVTGSTFTTADTVGALGITSSKGLTRDGRMKPDITAPGNNTFGALMLSLQASFIGGPSNWKVSDDSLHLIDGGTSMASPVVAGIIALYMQRYPQLNWLEIKNAVIASAITDSFTTTNVPNNKWGYGKIDAFKLLDTLILNQTCQPTNSNHSFQICNGDSVTVGGQFYFNAGNYSDTLLNAAGCDSIISIELMVDVVTATITGNGISLTANQTGTNLSYQWYDCDNAVNIPDATNQNFSPAANGNYAVMITDSNGCNQLSSCLLINGVGVQELNFENSLLNIYPNPSGDEVAISFDNKTENKNYQVSITNVLGRELIIIQLNQNTEIINIRMLSSGIYHCNLLDRKTILAHKKLVKL